MRIAVLAGLVALLEARPATACVCAGTFALPHPDAVDVPVNLRELIFSRGFAPFELRHSVTGEAVAIGPVVQIWGPSQPVYRVTIDQALEPATTYAFYTSESYAYRFTTGAVPKTNPPGDISIAQLEVESIDTVEPSGGSCRGSSFEVASMVVLPPDTASVGVRFRGDRQLQERILPAYTEVLSELGDGTCTIHIDLKEGITYEVEVWARDLAGNEGPVAKTTVEVTGGCGGCTSTSTKSTSLLVLALIAVIRPRRVAGLRRGA